MSVKYIISTILAATLSLAVLVPAPALAAGDCSAAAARVVAQTGGQLLSARPSGQGVCSVTVLVPGKGDQRPKKVTISVRQ